MQSGLKLRSPKWNKIYLINQNPIDKKNEAKFKTLITGKGQEYISGKLQ
jgi:hypothetical protein